MKASPLLVNRTINIQFNKSSSNDDNVKDILYLNPCSTYLGIVSHGVHSLAERCKRLTPEKGESALNPFKRSPFVKLEPDDFKCTFLLDKLPAGYAKDNLMERQVNNLRQVFYSSLLHSHNDSYKYENYLLSLFKSRSIVSDGDTGRTPTKANQHYEAIYASVAQSRGSLPSRTRQEHEVSILGLLMYIAMSVAYLDYMERRFRDLDPLKTNEKHSGKPMVLLYHVASDVLRVYLKNMRTIRLFDESTYASGSFMYSLIQSAKDSMEAMLYGNPSTFRGSEEINSLYGNTYVLPLGGFRPGVISDNPEEASRVIKINAATSRLIEHMNSSKTERDFIMRFSSDATSGRKDQAPSDVSMFTSFIMAKYDKICNENRTALFDIYCRDMMERLDDPFSLSRFLLYLTLNGCYLEMDPPEKDTDTETGEYTPHYSTRVHAHGRMERHSGRLLSLHLKEANPVLRVCDLLVSYLGTMETPHQSIRDLRDKFRRVLNEYYNGSKSPLDRIILVSYMLDAFAVHGDYVSSPDGLLGQICIHLMEEIVDQYIGSFRDSDPYLGIGLVEMFGTTLIPKRSSTDILLHEQISRRESLADRAETDRHPVPTYLLVDTVVYASMCVLSLVARSGSDILNATDYIDLYDIIKVKSSQAVVSFNQILSRLQQSNTTHNVSDRIQRIVMDDIRDLGAMAMDDPNPFNRRLYRSKGVVLTEIEQDFNREFITDGIMSINVFHTCRIIESSSGVDEDGGGGGTGTLIMLPSQYVRLREFVSVYLYLAYMGVEVWPVDPSYGVMDRLKISDKLNRAPAYMMSDKGLIDSLRNFGGSQVEATSFNDMTPHMNSGVASLSDRLDATYICMVMKPLDFIEPNHILKRFLPSSGFNSRGKRIWNYARRWLGVPEGIRFENDSVVSSEKLIDQVAMDACLAYMLRYHCFDGDRELSFDQYMRRVVECIIHLYMTPGPLYQYSVATEALPNLDCFYKNIGTESNHASLVYTDNTEELWKMAAELVHLEEYYKVVKTKDEPPSHWFSFFSRAQENPRDKVESEYDESVETKHTSEVRFPLAVILVANYYTVRTIRSKQ